MKYLLFLFLGFSFLSRAQIPKSFDSLQTYLKTKPKDTLYVLALNDLAMFQMQKGDFGGMNTSIASMENLSNQLNFKTGFYKTANMKGVLHYAQQNPKKALDFFLQSGAIIEKYKLEKKYYQNYLNNLMIIYNDLGEREKATQYALDLIEFQEKNKLNPLKTAPYDQMAKNLKFYKKYDEALAYFNRTLKIESQQKSLTGMAIAENSIANVYEDKEDVKTAIIHLKKGLQYAEKANYKLLQTDLLTNLGRLLLKTKHPDEAEIYLLKSEKLCRELDAKSSLKIVCQNLGEFYEEKKDHKTALRYYLEALKISKELEDPEYQYSANEKLAEFYSNNNDYKQAFFYKTEAEKFKDSVFEIKTQENTENILRKYEAGKRQEQIKTLSAENQLKNLQIKSAKRQRWFLGAGTVLFAIIGGMLFYQSRNRKRNNQKLQSLNSELDIANKNKLQFFGILNHDLRSPVASLVHFLHLQKENPELLDQETKERLNNQTTASAEQLLQQMEDLLLWSKSQMDRFEPQKKKFAIEELFAELKNEFIWANKALILFENPENIFLYSDKEILKTILRNLIANSLKVLDSVSEGKIICKAILAKGIVQISVKDNAGGAEIEKFNALYKDDSAVGIKHGLGLHLIRDLCKAIYAEIEVRTDVNIGETEVVISLKS